MSSYVEIANSALDLVGQQQIADLTDSTAAARKANLHIYDAVREVLGVGRWTSAKKGPVALAQLADAPISVWDYAYTLPTDYISMFSVNEADPDDPALDLWDIYGRRLLTDETAVNLVYISDLTASGNDINAATPLLTECFTLKLATKLAWAFQQSRTLRESLLEEYRAKLRTALSRDARESRRPIVNQLLDSNWIRNRVSSTDG